MSFLALAGRNVIQSAGQVYGPSRAPGGVGHELRRPEADTLRDGIHELRVSRQGVQYRVLYFFVDQVPDKEIDLAVLHQRHFAAAPEKHIYYE